MGFSDDGEPIIGYDEEGRPVTASIIAEERDRRLMAHDAFGRDFRRMIFDELDEDQLGTLQYLFRILGNTETAAVLPTVTWYEGLVDGACHARARASEGELPEPTRDCHPFEADTEDPTVFWACTFREDGLVCGRERGAEAHAAWESGDRLA